LEQPNYPNLIGDYHNSEDAGIYRINDETVIIQTVDFFPPIVNDPFEYGQIAAANSLSDIYAMGAKPITALSIVSFPKNKLKIEYLREILAGGMDKLKEAKTALVGGHSVEDDELKYGLSVTGISHPNDIWKNNGTKEGDIIIMTKKIGTGIINTALRAGFASEESLKESSKQMRELNKYSADIAKKIGISSCTDVTGFGLIGHLYEMIDTTNLSAILNFDEIPILPGTIDYAQMAMIPEGSYNNREFRQSSVKNYDQLSDLQIDLLFDPQTSGGLLFSVNENKANLLLKELIENGIDAHIIGEFVKGDNKIEIK